MDPKPQKLPFLFASPFSVWTDLAFKLWGFGKPAGSNSAEKQVAVAVIPTRDAQPKQPAKAARAQNGAKRTKGKSRGKSRAKRAKR